MSGLSTSTCRSSLDVRLVDQYLPVEAARAQQCRIEHLGAVGRAHDDDALARIEAVHLRQQLIQGLLALLVAAKRTLDAHLAERVELVDEDDARRLCFSLLEQVADARRADTDEHLDELGPAQAEERHVRLAGDGAGEQRLPRARRTDQQHALGNAAAQIRVLLRVLQELDDLFELVLRLVDAGHIREAHLHLIVGVDLGAAPRERHHAALGAAHAPEEEAPDRDEEDERDDPAEHIRQPVIGRLAGVLDVFRLELLSQLRILDPRCRKLPAFRIGAHLFGERPADRLIADRDLGDLAVLEQRLELGVRNGAAGRRQEVHLREAEQEQEREPVPERR